VTIMKEESGSKQVDLFFERFIRDRENLKILSLAYKSLKNSLLDSFIHPIVQEDILE